MKLQLSLSLAITLSLPMMVEASWFAGNEPLVVAEAQAQAITEDEAAVIASKATGGRVISSETRGVEGVTVYRFKVLMGDGYVKIIQVKASSGEIF